MEEAVPSAASPHPGKYTTSLVCDSLFTEKPAYLELTFSEGLSLSATFHLMGWGWLPRITIKINANL